MQVATNSPDITSRFTFPKLNYFGEVCWLTLVVAVPISGSEATSPPRITECQRQF
jgi:hypothetical protein